MSIIELDNRVLDGHTDKNNTSLPTSIIGLLFATNNTAGTATEEGRTGATPTSASESLVYFIKRHEGHAPTGYGFYDDPSGYCTVGYGHLVAKQTCSSIDALPAGSRLKRDKDSLSWITSEADADRQLRIDIQAAVDAVRRHVTVPLTQYQLDALTDFVFNLGEGQFARSTLLRELNARHYDRVPQELMRYRFSRDVELRGLVLRRTSEVAMWNYGIY